MTQTSVDVQSGTISVGTSAQYPAGTPLQLILATTSTEEGDATHSAKTVRIFRGSEMLLDLKTGPWQEPTQQSIVVYAGETLTPWMLHGMTGDTGDYVKAWFHVDMWTTVPEPATLALLMLGGLALRRR